MREPRGGLSVGPWGWPDEDPVPSRVWRSVRVVYFVTALRTVVVVAYIEV
ncbi:hypothetical protein [Streptomyces sp. NBC_00328]|nr:hypothetical protein [Streptomyces sp. NBC_00328]